ncbi:putative membrane protein [Moraxella catarrhalis]|nr:putative membrane protein [Moraxella catarrhalis]
MSPVHLLVMSLIGLTVFFFLLHLIVSYLENR